jgi:hypothetical protein
MSQDAMTHPIPGAAAPVLPGAPGQVSLEMARAYDPQPTWNRQTPESWDMIREEYLGGATAKQIAVKWRIGASSLYRRAYLGGWSKKALAKVVGEAAQARAAEAEAEEIARLIARPEPARERTLEEDADTPEAIRELALGAVARCLRQGRYADAERMGRLAETLTRLSEPKAGPELTLDHFRTPNIVPRPWEDEPPPPGRTPEEEAVMCAEVGARITELADRLEAQGLLEGFLAIDTEAQDQARAETAFAEYQAARRGGKG